MTAAKLRLAQATMGRPETGVGELCAELGSTRQTLHRRTGRDQEPLAGACGTEAGGRHA